MKDWNDPEEWMFVEKGTEIKVARIRGRFTFHAMNADGSVCVIGGSGGRRMFRSFRLDRCRPIYRRKGSEPRA
jgi:hypothetical protein